MDLGLKGKVAFITGASGGIGWATAEAFAREGAQLALFAHGYESGIKMENRANQLPHSSKPNVVFGDVTRDIDLGGLLKKILNDFGRVDICVANAGVAPSQDMAVDEMNLKRFHQVLDVNLMGAILTARAFFKVLRETRQENASLIFVGSTSGRFGEKGHAEYSASKAALYGLTKTLAMEIVDVSPKGRVNMVSPGWIRTPMTKDFEADEKQVHREMKTRALGRIGLSEEVAKVIVFLASDAASYVTGQDIGIDGGMGGRVLRD